MNYQNYQMPVMQNRLNQMEQQYPQFQQGYYQQQIYQSPYTQMQQPQPTQVLKGRPVTGIDEAKASMIDLDGSIFIFPDYGNNRIYTKQINLDGTASIKSYVLENPKQNTTAKEPQKVSENQFELNEAVKLMSTEIEALKKQILELKQSKGGKQNVQQSNERKH